MPIVISGVCKQNACPIRTSGKCLEDYDSPEDCEYFIPAETGDSIEDDTTDGIDERYQEDTTGVVSFSESELHGAAVDQILAASPTKVIVIAGRPESGKTTLVGTLADQFHQGEYAEHLFHASKTLGGLEKRCFDARLASGRTQAKTQRTLLEDNVRFLHLVVRHADLSPPRPLLFADISGEAFEQMQLRLDEVRRHLFLRRADHFVLLFDTARLMHTAMRQEEKTAGYDLMNSMVQEGMLGKHTRVEVVFSRWDLAVHTEQKEAIRRFTERIRNDFERSFRSALETLAFFEVAARPILDSGLPSAYGLENLFRTWLEKPVRDPAEPQAANSLPATIREYITLRHAQSLGGNL